MQHIVTTNGKYHGYVETEAEAMRLDVVQKGVEGTVRLISDDEWKKVAAGNGDRAALCASLGKLIK